MTISADSSSFDRILDQFEDRWKAHLSDRGKSECPLLEEYLPAVGSPDAKELVWELIALDLYYRLRTDESGPITDRYHQFSGFELNAAQKNELQALLGRYRQSASSGTDSGPYVSMRRLQGALCAGAPAAGAAPSETRLRQPNREVDTENLPAGVASQLGQYRLLGKIGQGGMGSVYKALHLRLEKTVAVKILSADRLSNPEDIARFEREMRAVGKLNHPHIIRATDAGEVNGVPYLVMDFVEGTDLHKLVGRLGPLPIAEACELVRQAAEGLQHAHAHHLVHRDVKPSNLLLSSDGEVKVLDLGLARFHTEQPANHDLTSLGQGMGTLDYMAPEQALDAHSVDIRADVYSLGCTLYHLLAGQPPFGGSAYLTPASKLAAHSQLPAPPIGKLRPEVPEALAALLGSLLAKRPADRPATPREVAELLAPFAVDCDLRRLLAASGSASATPGDAMLVDTAPSRRTPTEASLIKEEVVPLKHPSRSRRFAVIAAVVVVGMLAVAAVWLPRDPWPPRPKRQAEQDPKPVVESPVGKADKQTPAGDPKKETPEPVPVKEPDRAVAEQGIALLKKYCHRCHGIDFKVPHFNVLDRAGLVASRGKDEPAYVVPGKPQESYLWQRVSVDEDMPPKGTKPNAEEKEVLKKWIVAGAPFPGRPVRPFKSEKDVLSSVREHLRKTSPADRPFQRYFTLTHLYNNHHEVMAEDLNLYRAGLSKLVNSLSWKPRVVVPKAVDPEETVFAVDLRDLGWDSHDLWKEILKAYPYGLTHRRDTDAAMRELAVEVYDLAGTDVPCLRADWFIATASRPPLYHTLLALPNNASDLEKLLQVDVRRDFLQGKLARAGMTASGVSKQNRLVDRHDAIYGAYWKSYDFKSDDGAGNLVNFPLGPLFADHPFADRAFRHAGGEIIFNLPNGLQAYLLIDEKGQRIDVGPVDIVRDALETAGTPQIVNGLSCMACHKNGVIRFEDLIRGSTAVKGDARLKVQALYRTKEEMDRLLTRDEERFLRALDEAASQFLKVGDDKDKSLRDFPEPIGAGARLYVKNLGLNEAAYELGIEPTALKTLLANNRRLRALGLGPLADGGTIQRSVWSSLENLTSLFQIVARELELGTPHVSF
jgi:serine/threonine-protein kinase